MKDKDKDKEVVEEERKYVDSTYDGYWNDEEDTDYSDEIYE